MRCGRIYRFIVYNLLGMIVLSGMIELTTRTISWFSGQGFTLGLHELEAYDPGIEGIYAWHPFTGFTFRANRTFVAGHPYDKRRVTQYTDANGFLCDKAAGELTYEKGDNEIRVAAIGASTTANLNLTYEENWPGCLGRMLRQRFPDKTVTIINAAVPGFDTAESIGNLALRVMPFKPDVVIIYHLYNDLKAIQPHQLFRPDYSHVHNTPMGFHEKPGRLFRFLDNSMFYVRTRARYRELVQNQAAARAVEGSASGSQQANKQLSEIPREAEETFRQHMTALVSIAQGGGARIVLSSFATLHDPGLDWSDLANTGKRLDDLQKAELISLMRFTPGLSLPGIFKGFRQYNRVLEEIARDYHTGWVDNGALLPHEKAYFVDRVHFSQEGARRMAENFFPVVVSLLTAPAAAETRDNNIPAER